MKGFFYRIFGMFIWLILFGIISSIGDLFSDNKSSVNTTKKDPPKKIVKSDRIISNSIKWYDYKNYYYKHKE